MGKPNNKLGLFTELKRRNVFRVGVAYIVGAWLLAQCADLVLDVIGAPDIVLRSLVALLGLGLVPAVIFAWVFEMTPEGVKRESEIDRSQSITGETGKKLNMATIVLVIAAVSFVVFERYLPKDGSDEAVAPANPVAAVQDSVKDSARVDATPANEKSIAVLPFANRSNQQDDLFFTDGIHDDLLTQLAKIHDLEVISRTSVMEYRDTRKNLKEIGAELNVATILEGGIQKVGNRVRINAQLIDVTTDKHLWAETFDRELTAENIFELQSEIARKIMRAIAVELTPEEELRLSEKPTNNLVAYEAYLKAREIYYNSNYSRSREIAAVPLLEKAIKLDPEYAEALAMLADVLGQLYWRGINTSEEFVTEYRSTIDRALELNPNSPSALRASANYHYRVDNNYTLALELVEQALQLAPGDADLIGDRGLCLRRLGRFDESIASFLKALEIDPANTYYRSLAVETMSIEHRWQDIIDTTVPLADANPDDLDMQVTRALATLNLNGDLGPLEQVFQKMNLIDSSDYMNWSARVYYLKREPDKSIEVLNNTIWNNSQMDPVFETYRDYQLASAYRLKGDHSQANLHFELVTDKLGRLLESSLQAQVYEGMMIATSMAWMDRHEEALDLALQLLRENPIEKDAMLYGWLLSAAALVKGITGDHEGAIDDLAVALEIPAAFRTSRWELYYDPDWDFMRDNPRFVELATPPTVIRTVTP